MSEELNVLILGDTLVDHKEYRSAGPQTIASACIDRSANASVFSLRVRFTLNPNSESSKRSIDQIEGSFLSFR
jgi:hypothetical protein